MPKSGHIPMRMCAVTREKLPKKDLVRLAVEDGKVVVDENGKVRSRGVNIKPEIGVFDQFAKINGFKRFLNISVKSEEVEELRNSFKEYVDNRMGEKKVVRISSDKLNDILSGNA